MPSNYFKSGEWNIICDVCGFKFKASEIKKRWDGLLVCTSDYELDHPQKYIRVREDGQSVPYIRDEPEDTFLYVCYIWGASAFADLAEADCARADNELFSYAFLTGEMGPTPEESFDGMLLDDDPMLLDDDEMGLE